MLKNRLIPVLLIRNGLLVRSELFEFHQAIGKPIPEIERYNDWNIDELILLDISKYSKQAKVTSNAKMIHLLKDISKKCFMPLTVGGGICTIDDVYQRIFNGADKVAINTEALLRPGFITEAAREFGNQAIVVSMDIKKNNNHDYEVFSHGGQIPTGKNPEQWALEAEEKGAGEILLNSIDRDGTGNGYDLNLIQKIVDIVSIPVVCCGGAKQWNDFIFALQAGASGVAAGNLFHFKEMSYIISKQKLAQHDANVR